MVTAVVVKSSCVALRLRPASELEAVKGRAVFEPEALAFRLFGRDFRPLTSSDPFYTLLDLNPSGEFRKITPLETILERDPTMIWGSAPSR